MSTENQPVQVVARNIKTGAEYIFVEVIPHAPHLCSVMTEESYPQTWLVDTKFVEFIDKSQSK